jgi:apurinic endonuclease APN1
MFGYNNNLACKDYTVRSIGLHLRLTSTLTALIEKALRLKLDIFQCFLVRQETMRLIDPQPEDAFKFLELRREHFQNFFVHGSYWVNLSGVSVPHHKSLARELRLARSLECTDIILHAGSAKGGKNKREGIEAAARVINAIHRENMKVRVVLENSAHGRMTVGSDFEDYKIILELLDDPNAVSFCVDTAHAHSYGYDITTPSAQAEFVDLLDATIGIHRIALIHLNDTNQRRGSKIDKHEIIGEGVLGDEALKQFVLNPRLKNIPLIMELPELPEDDELKIVDKVRNWHR